MILAQGNVSANRHAKNDPWFKLSLGQLHALRAQRRSNSNLNLSEYLNHAVSAQPATHQSHTHTHTHTHTRTHTHTHTWQLNKAQQHADQQHNNQPTTATVTATTTTTTTTTTTSKSFSAETLNFEKLRSYRLLHFRARVLCSVVCGHHGKCRGCTPLIVSIRMIHDIHTLQPQLVGAHACMYDVRCGCMPVCSDDEEQGAEMLLTVRQRRRARQAVRRPRRDTMTTRLYNYLMALMAS